jgi:hypothetical protein
LSGKDLKSSATDYLFECDNHFENVLTEPNIRIKQQYISSSEKAKRYLDWTSIINTENYIK